MTELWEEAAGQRERLLAWARSMTRDSGAAEEAVQDTLMQAWLKGTSVRQHSARWSWLYSVLLNRVRSGVRSRQRRERTRLLPLVEEPELPGPDDRDAPDETSAETLLRIECLMSLRDSYREILEVVYMHDFTVSEFARTRGLTRNAAKVRLYRARKALRRELERPCDPGNTTKDSPRCQHNA